MQPYAGLSEDVRGALLAAPESERSLLELRLVWPALGDRQALSAARLRVLLLSELPALTQTSRQIRKPQRKHRRK